MLLMQDTFKTQKLEEFGGEIKIGKLNRAQMLRDQASRFRQMGGQPAVDVMVDAYRRVSRDRKRRNRNQMMFDRSNDSLEDELNYMNLSNSASRSISRSSSKQKSVKKGNNKSPKPKIKLKPKQGQIKSSKESSKASSKQSKQSLNR